MSELYKNEFNFKISNYEKYIKSIKEKQPILEEIAGELLNGKLMRIHKSISSSRSDLKKLNTEVQNYLVNILEPLLTLSNTMGFDYPVEVVKEIWKLMFENAAHDSIGSCVSDTTNEDVYLRYKQARDLAENLAELKMREIVMRINCDSDITATAFNLSGRSKSGIVETDFYVPQLDFSIKDSSGNEYEYTITKFEDQTDYILGQGNVLDSAKDTYKPEKVYKVHIAIHFENLPAFGYKNFYLDLEGNTHKRSVESYKTQIENEFYKINVNKDNTLDILDKVTGKIYKNQAIIEENGDDGDSFNYSPPRQDLVVRSSEFKPKIIVEESELIKRMELQYDFIVPGNLDDRLIGLRNSQLPVSLSITLKKSSPIIEFKFNVDNRFVDSHRMCVVIDSDIASKFSKADHQFGSIKRPVVRKEMSLWEVEPEKWNEVPISIETCQSFVTLDNVERGVAVIPKGVREYEIVGDEFNSIRLTLFRTYGCMGKENLLYRLGRASGETVIETPDAQCHKNMEFEFSVIYYKGNMNDYGLSQVVSDYLKEIQVYQYSDYLNTRLRFTQFDVERNLPENYCIFELEGDGILSLVKKAEERNGYILRFYNGDYKIANNLKLNFKKISKIIEIVNLKEETKEIYTESSSIVLPTMNHNKILSVYIEYQNVLK